MKREQTKFIVVLTSKTGAPAKIVHMANHSPEQRVVASFEVPANKTYVLPEGWVEIGEAVAGSLVQIDSYVRVEPLLQ